MADTWEAWKALITDDPRAEWCEELVSRLPAGARVVELGCGGGAEETARLAQRFRLTGVDLSAGSSGGHGSAFPMRISCTPT